MSTSIDETTVLVAPPVVLTRTFDAELTAGDGRTVDVRIAPYNVAATVADPPDFRPYKERFAPGAFERQVSAPDRVRVWLNFEHEQGIRGIVGHGVSLRDGADGLDGSFRVHDNTDGDKTLSLVREGLLTGVSLEFRALRSRHVGGVVERVRAHIDRVSLCRTPAYSDARVLAVREAVEAAEPTPIVFDVPETAPELVERLAALGVEPLRRISTTSKAWDGSPARFTDEQYKASTLFCRGQSDAPKTDCSLPVLEPDGTLNVNALGAAAGALAGGRGGVTNVGAAMKAAAARKLIRYYSAAGKEPPASLLAVAKQ
jgi:HK97 family phage prohead protease